MTSALITVPLLSLPLPQASSKSERVTSLGAYGDKLIIGTSAGALYIYQVEEKDGIEESTNIPPLNEPTGSESPQALEAESNQDQLKPARTGPLFTTDLESVHRNISYKSRSIDKIFVLRDADVLIILSGSIISLYTLSTLEFTSTLPQTKGANEAIFSIGVTVTDKLSGSTSSVARLVVSVNKLRKLLCFEWIDGEFTRMREITTPEKIYSLAWTAWGGEVSQVIMGFQSSKAFAVVDFDQDDLVLKLISHSRDLIAQAGTQNSIGTYGIGIGSFVSFGSYGSGPLAVPLGSLNFDPLAPVSDPNLQNNVFVNTHAHDSGGLEPEPESYINDPGILLVTNNDSIIVARSGQVLDGRSSSLRLFKTVTPTALELAYPYLLAILPKCIEVRNPITTSLLQNINMTGPKVIYNSNRLVYVADSSTVYKLVPENYSKVIDSIAGKGYYEEAISLLRVIPNVWISDKDVKLRHLNILKATDLFKQGKYDDAMFLFIDISASPDDVIPLCASLIEGEQVEENSVTEPPPNNTHLEADTTAIITSSAISTISSGDKTPRSAQDSANPQDALRSLLSYLVDARRKISKLASAEPNSNLTYNGIRLIPEFYGPDLAHAATRIDTALLKCYMQINPGLIGPLLRVPNSCDPKVVKEMLESNAKWTELVDFYYTRGLHRDSLELLKRIGASEYSQLNIGYDYQSTYSGDDDDDDGSTGISSTASVRSNENLVSTSGDRYRPLVRYLQRLDNSNLDIIFEFAKAPIESNLRYGHDIFIEDSTQSESLSRSRVFKYLKDLSTELCISYLEHIIYHQNENSANYHTNLVLLYIELIKRNAAEKESAFDKAVGFLKSANSNYAAERVLTSLPRVNNYELQDPRLIEIRALLLCRQEKHRMALSLLVFNLQNQKRAREYATEVYDQDPIKGKEVLYTLFELYLEGAPSGEYDISKEILEESALELLSTQGSRMEITKVLQIVPSTFSIASLQSIITSQIRAVTSELRTIKMESALAKVELIHTQDEYLTLKSQSVVITETDTCPVCSKRLGHSVVSAFPAGADNDDQGMVVVHYGCAQAYKDELQLAEEKLDRK